MSITQSQIAKALGSKFYGIFGSPYFDFSDNSCAESIAAQCRDIIVYMQDAIRFYFNKKWHEDKELHKMLNLKHTPNVISEDVICYSVSDSAYINLDIVLDSINKEDGVDSETLSHVLYEIRLKPYFEKRLETYCRKYNVENRFEFRKDGLYSNVCFFATNNYIMYDKSCDDIVVKGSFLSQNSKGSYINKVLKDFCFLLMRDNVKSVVEMQEFLINAWSKFSKCKVDEICIYKSIGDIDADTYSAKACKRYNNIINNRYVPIMNDDVVSLYVDDKGEWFAYLGECYPMLIAPMVDYKTMFYDTVVKECNSVIKQMGMPYVFDSNCDVKVDKIMLNVGLIENKALLRYIEDERVVPKYLVQDIIV